MEDKIEVGEYVRTKKGRIDKVERFSVGLCIWHCENGMCIDECNRVGTHLDDIVKHSKQIIDLSEVGDIVNNHRVKAVYLDGATKYIKLHNSYDNGLGIRTYNEDIQTILTKECYMANCYKVGGENG